MRVANRIRAQFCGKSPVGFSPGQYMDAQALCKGHLGGEVGAAAKAIDAE